LRFQRGLAGGWSEDWNKELYGHPIKNREIITGTTAPPAAADEFMKELNKYSSRK